MDLDALRQFGLQANRLIQPSIEVGGFVVPGDAAGLGSTSRLQEIKQYGPQGGEGPAEAGSPAGAWTRSCVQTAAASEAAHPFGALTGGTAMMGEFDELAEYYPDVRVAASSPTLDILTLRAGLFRSLPYSARLFLEIPHSRSGTEFFGAWQFRFGASAETRLRRVLVPQVRVWSFWDSGAEAGLPIMSHHEYPDGSMCVCKSDEWIRGRDLIVDYVNFCVCWIAKTLHDQLIGFYPGLQHVPAHIRRRRDRGAEYCGCGEQRRYQECCQWQDLALSNEQLIEDRESAAKQYSAELHAQRRLRDPLRHVGRAASPHPI
jgi:hypothetical protein